MLGLKNTRHITLLHHQRQSVVHKNTDITLTKNDRQVLSYEKYDTRYLNEEWTLIWRRRCWCCSSSNATEFAEAQAAEESYQQHLSFSEPHFAKW